MLLSLHIQVVQKLLGLSPASYFEYATGLSRMTFQRGRAYEAMLASSARVQAHVDSLMLGSLRKRGATDADYQFCKDRMPEGVSAMMVYGLGLLGDKCAPATRELVAQLDASDRYLFELGDCSVAEALSKLRRDPHLGPAYSASLSVSGLRRPLQELPGDDERALLELVLTRRAHMTLSLLAALDHELGRWNTEVTGSDSMGRRPRFAALLARPEPAARVRRRPMDPIARLVDFVGSAGHRVRNGHWPDTSPTVAEMGVRAELSRSFVGDGSRFIQALRSGKHPMTRRAFQTLVYSQFWTPDTSPDALNVAADLAEPYLVAAHLLTLLMPDHPAAKGHLDRAGWREAYLEWWARHADSYAPARPSDDAAPPDWLLNP
ncbi:hypothetical protein ACQVBX_10865 [Dyella sp. KULCS107]|uniref:hypothetical protein n=1 Tax=Dyella sp. KULCS107 TaxID=3422216 RepID=UPI003D6EEC9C